MTIKKILLTGIGAGATEESIRSWLGHFGPIERLEIIREGDPAAPIALVEMNISDEAAGHLLSRLTDYWHEGAMINARLLSH